MPDPESDSASEVEPSLRWPVHLAVCVLAAMVTLGLSDGGWESCTDWPTERSWAIWIAVVAFLAGLVGGFWALRTAVRSEGGRAVLGLLLTFLQGGAAFVGFAAAISALWAGCLSS